MTRSQCSVAYRLLGCLFMVVAAILTANAQPPKIEEVEKASAAVQKGKVDDAYKLLQDAVKKRPELPPARLLLAQLMLTNRDMATQARATLELAATENPDHPLIYLQNAGIAYSEGRTSDAIVNCEKALTLAAASRWTASQRKSFDTEAHTLLAGAFEQRRDWPQARIHVSALLDINPKNGSNRQRLAVALFFLGKTDDAESELRTAVKDDPSLESPAIVMGKLWSNKGDEKRAREWMEKAVKADGQNVRTHLAYGEWLIQQNEFEQAKIHIETALRIDPRSLDGLRFKGLIARVEKDLKTAEGIFKQVLDIAPADRFATNQLALALADQSDEAQRSKATLYAEANAQRFPRDVDVIGTLIYAYYRTGKNEDAQKFLQLATSSGTMTSDRGYFCALVFFDSGKFEEAVRLLEGALGAKGLFVYRPEAQKLFDKAKAKAKTEAKP